LTPPKKNEAMMLYIVATTTIVNTTIVVERKEEGHVYKVQRPIYLARYYQNRRSGIRIYKNYSTPLWSSPASFDTTSMVTRS
jgi:hypothetical protein